MNERQSQELQELENLEVAGTLDDSQKERFEELKEIKVLFEKAKSADTLQVQKEKFREKFEAEERAKKELEDKLNGIINDDPSKATKKAPLDVVDYIDISTSLDGLDQREKAYLAEQHRLTGKPLKEIREAEDFQLWSSAYKAKLEKETGLKPGAGQPDANAPVSVKDKLVKGSLAEKEALLKELGLYKEPKQRSDKAHIGTPRTG